MEIYIGSSDLPLWKIKGVELNLENLLENVFILTSDLASYFEIRHNDLLERNIRKLQKEKYLPDHLRNFAQMVEIGSSAKRTRSIYALTRHQTECVIMDFSGPKARKKKYSILLRLQAIEVEVLKGNLPRAQQKSSSWDGIQLLKKYGFKSSLGNDLAIKKDVVDFLKIPTSTLNSFLKRHSHQIKPVKLDRETICSIGSRARHLNAYKMDDIVKICFWANSKVGLNIKKKILGKVGISAPLKQNKEIQWYKTLSEIFEGFELERNYDIGRFRVDFFVKKLGLILECDQENHKSYDKQKEEKRDKVLIQNHALIRFNDKINPNLLFNAILKAKLGQVIKLYI